MFLIRPKRYAQCLSRSRQFCRQRAVGRLDSSELPQRLVVVDGFLVLFRAFHGLPDLTDEAGAPTGAVYGLARMLLETHMFLPAAFVAVAFDGTGATDGNGGVRSTCGSERRKILDTYKRNRKLAPERLVSQFPRARDLCEAIGVPFINAPCGAEADDVIASCVARARGDGFEVVIVSSDKDLQQLVTDDAPRVSVALPGSLQRPRGEQAVLDAHGVLPARLGDLLALAGDASDGVPGVPGVGPKLARRLLDSYDSLDALLRDAEAGQVAVPGFGPKKLAALRREAENVRIYRRVVQLRCDLAVPNTRDLLWRPDGGLAACFDRFGFPALARQSQSAVDH